MRHIYLVKRENHQELETLFLFTCDLEISPEVRASKSLYDKRLALGYKILTNILNKYDIKGTFFVEGKICVDYPELVEELHKDGHEIGSHGFYHESFADFWPIGIRLFPKVSPLYRRITNIRKSKQAIYSIIGENPVSFRAPYLAIDEKTLPILENEGFLLDSSLYNPAFGKLSYPYHPLKNNPAYKGEMKILEVPITTSIIPYRKLIYQRYPLIFDLDEKDIKKAIHLITDLFILLRYPFALFVTLIHPQEVCSHAYISKISTFLKIMSDIGASSLTATQLIRKLQTS